MKPFPCCTKAGGWWLHGAQANCSGFSKRSINVCFPSHHEEGNLSQIKTYIILWFSHTHFSSIYVSKFSFFHMDHSTSYYQAFKFILTFTFLFFIFLLLFAFPSFKNFFIYMCVCVNVVLCLCSRMYKCLCTCKYMEARVSFSMPLCFLGQGLSVNLESTSSIDWLATKSPGLSSQHLPRAGIMGKCHCTKFFSWVLEMWTLNLTLACVVFYQPSHLPSILLCSPGWPGVLDPPTPAFPPNARISGIHHTQFSFSFSHCKTNRAP